MIKRDYCKIKGHAFKIYTKEYIEIQNNYFYLSTPKKVSNHIQILFAINHTPDRIIV